MLRKADLITCDGENMKEEMINMGINPNKIGTVYHGVNLKLFNPKQKNEKLKEDLKIYNSPIVVSTRTLTLIHDIWTTIKSIPLVLKEVPDTKFIIVGRGKTRLHEELAKSLGILDNIRFIGLVQHHELPKYLASADVYVSTSLSDGGIAVSTLEAMACELPVVVTDSGDNKKWIKDGENGFVVPIKDPKSLAEKIVYLIKKEDARKRFGKLNRKMVEEKAEYYKEMEKMDKLYRELITRFKK